VGYDFAEKDLAHIRNVLNHIERPVGTERARYADAVIGVDYWRARIRAILAMPRLPIHIEKLAKELLGRLDQLENLRRERSTA
jgi:hypothetical protein